MIDLLRYRLERSVKIAAQESVKEHLANAAQIVEGLRSQCQTLDSALPVETVLLYVVGLHDRISKAIAQLDLAK